MLRPQPAAIGIVFNDDNEVLLVQRADVAIWVLPGGGIDAQETAEVAALREIKEETGLDVTIVRQSGDYYPLNHLTSPTSVFICRPLSTNRLEIKPSSETSDCQFFSLNTLPSSFFFLHKNWLDDALKNKNLVHRPIDEITYWGVAMYAVRHPLILIKFLITRLLSLFGEK